VNKATKPTDAAPENDEYLLALVRRAENGDTTTLLTLREWLKEPAAVDAFGGDLARRAQLMLINRFCSQNLLLKESLTRKLELLRVELAGPTPSPLERLLAERVVTCWLHLHLLEAVYAGKEGMSMELGAYYERNISSAQKRYLAAIRTLALIRKLAVPVLQVNIAKKQVNMVSPCGAAESE
jgi:hypothetical protein